MSALAGIVDLGGGLLPAEACSRMLDAMRDFGPDGSSRRQQKNCCIGVADWHVLPEDDLEPQPVEGGGGRYLLALDGRIDNRAELAERLGLARRALTEMSDARLAMLCWERWQLASFDYFLGDIALAAWDDQSGKLTIARGPLSSRTICYHHGPKMLAFASMPGGILALPEIDKAIDLEEVAAIAAGGSFQPGPGTFFKNIRLLAPGSAIEFGKDRERSKRIWNLDPVDLPARGFAELAEALRAEFDRAVAAQLRRREGSVATHLSAGRDSSAVTATAARVAGGSDEILAFTGAPRHGFDDGADQSWLVDESALAAQTARDHPNIRHTICRPEGGWPSPMLDQLNRVHFGPLLNPSNLPWSAQINDAAAGQGASILLAGSLGNFSISLGGRGMLVNVLRERGLASWLRQAARTGGSSPSAWRGLVSDAIGPWLSRTTYGLLHRLGGSSTGAEELPLLKPPFRQRAESIRAARNSDWRPPRSFRQLIRETLLANEPGEKLLPAIWGLDLRDPTADRRLVALCLSLPAEALFSPDGGRPLFEAAFADRLPAEVLRNRRRGYQTADWFEQFDPARVREAFGRYLKNPLVSEIFDIHAVGHLLDRWPRAGGWKVETIDTYRNQLLGGLAIASFIDVHFPS